VRLGDQPLKRREIAVLGVDAPVIQGVVSVIARRLEHRHQPDAVDTEIRRRRGIAVIQIVEPRGQAGKIAQAVAVQSATLRTKTS
jgi:hypothetical protein